MRKNSIKNRRINDEVRKSLSEIIRSEVHDPRISPFTSISACEVAPDLKTAKIFISVYGDAKSGQETLEGLKRAGGFIRSMLARDLNLRNTPELRFILDDSIAYGVNMSHRIDEVIAADEELRAISGPLEESVVEKKHRVWEDPDMSWDDEDTEE